MIAPLASIAPPSRLVTPEDLVEGASGAPVMGWWMVGVLVVLCVAGIVAAWILRRRRGCVRERAFAMLCRRRGITRAGIARLRESARDEGLSSPLALLVCPESIRARRAARSDHAGLLGITLPGRTDDARPHRAA